MDTNLITQNQNSENQTELTELQVDLALEIEQLNLICYQFKIPDAEITRWSKYITKVEPRITPTVLNEIIFNLILGNYPFDRNLGITNIFNVHRRLILKKNGQV